MRPIMSAEHSSRNLGVAKSPAPWFGRSIEAPVHIPPWRPGGWLVQSWLPPRSSCRERGIPKMHCSEQASLISVALFTLFNYIPWLAVSIRWGLDSITMAIWIIQSSDAIISLFLDGGGRVWNTRLIKTFFVSDVSITDLAPKVKCLDYKMYIIWGSSYKSIRQVC